VRQFLSTLHTIIERQNAHVRSNVMKFYTMISSCLLPSRDIILDERELNFSKSDDEQSEMSNHDYEQDIKPVR
jgi:hypothetical protein